MDKSKSSRGDAPMSALGRLLPFKTLPHQLPLRVGSSYSLLSDLNFRFWAQSSYSTAANFRVVEYRFRP